MAQSRPSASEDPPAQELLGERVLTGDDAKRVDELEKKVSQLWQAGKDTEAQVAAREILAIRTRVQGAAHWQAADAKRLLRTLEQIAALPPDARAELTQAVRQASEAEQLYAQANYAAAEALNRKALAIRRNALGEEHPDTAQSCRSLAVALKAQRQYSEAELLYRKALEIRRKVLGEEHPDTGQSYNNLGQILDARNQYAPAELFYRQALKICRARRGEGHRDTATVYGNLAGNLRIQGQYAEAEHLHRKALEIRRKALGEGNALTAHSWNNLAVTLDDQAKYAEAEPLFRTALAICRTALGEEHSDTAACYNGLAYNLRAQGRYAEAEPLYRKALEICRKVLSEEHRHTAQNYNDLASNLYLQGRYTAAEALYRKALEICRRVVGEESLQTADSYNNLALSLTAQEKYAEAEPLYRQALKIGRRVLGEEHPKTATGYNNLARNLDAQGQYAAAEALYRKALEIDSKVLGGHPDTAGICINLARNLDAQGQYVAAEALYRKALEINSKVLGEGHPNIATGYKALASNLYAQGRYAEAEALWARAARSFGLARLLVTPTGLERTSFSAKRSPLPYLAAVVARQGKPADAWQWLEEDLARGLLDDLSIRQLRQLTSEEVKREQELVGKLHRLDEQIAALATKSSPMERCLHSSLSGLGCLPLFSWQTGFSASASAILQSTYYLGWSYLQTLAVRQGQRLAVQAEFSEFEQALVRKYGIAAGQTFELARIQAQLPAAAALVAWLDLKAPVKAADPNGEHWACVVRQRGEPIWVRLPGSGPNQAWTETDDQLPQRVWEGLVHQSPEAATHWRELAAQLYQQRLAPLVASLGATPTLPAVQHLIMLPTARVPLEALVEARPDNQPSYTISYAPSGTMFAWLQEQRHEANAKGRKAGSARLLALGDPVFTRPDKPALPAPLPPDHGALLTLVTPGSNAAQSGLRPGDALLSYAGTKLSRPADLRLAIAKATGAQQSDAQRGETGIPVTVWREGQILRLTVRLVPLGVRISEKPAAEALRVSRAADALLQRTREEAFIPLPGTRREVEAIARLFPQAETLLGAEAREERLDQLAAADELRNFRYLHFATHGIVNDQVAMQSALMLAQDPSADPVAQVLAGREAANGRVTAKHIRESWKLDAELVTLSACQTGLGKFSGGEGYVGFTQALFLAGARSLVVSLWKVDDDATALLMTRFYQNLLGQRPGLPQPMPKAAALEEAKTWLRQLTAAEAARRRPRGEVEQVDAILPGPTDSRPYEHPYYWAAFILIGDPGDLAAAPENQRSSLSGTIAWVIGSGVLVGALLLAVAARVWRRKLV
jgi:CHAT domain-containing protein/Flp pilus assembly protein TadD